MNQNLLPTITWDESSNAALVFSDGDFFLGSGVGKKGEAVGEICFNTSMTGYQEILTDPSYADQIITFSFPHIGNVGTNSLDVESKRCYAKGLIIREPITSPDNFRNEKALPVWLEENGLTGICEVDTRQITRKVRLDGAKVVCIVFGNQGESCNLQAIYEKLQDISTLKGKELAKEVTTESEYQWQEKRVRLGKDIATIKQPKYNVVAYDFGIKKNILRCLTDLDCNVTTVSADTPAEDVLSKKPDGVFLSNGPGDPFATSKYAVEQIKKLLDKNVPIFGICLGHQLLSLASGLQTQKMNQGHRGGNHPVKNLQSGAVEITSQNHGFCVSNHDIPNFVEVTHLSLFDGSIEGIRRTDKPAFSVQYHPESSPGPNDSLYLFQQFVDMMAKNKLKRMHI